MTGSNFGKEAHQWVKWKVDREPRRSRINIIAVLLQSNVGRCSANRLRSVSDAFGRNHVRYL